MTTVDTTPKQEQSSSSYLSDLTILKSGNSEKFSEEKIVRGVTRAGRPFMLANDISKLISSKFAENLYIPITSFFKQIERIYFSRVKTEKSRYDCRIIPWIWQK